MTASRSVALVVIFPHERHEAIEAWKDVLSPSHIKLIQDAPDDAVIKLYVSPGARILHVLPVVQESGIEPESEDRRLG